MPEKQAQGREQESKTVRLMSAMPLASGSGESSGEQVNGCDAIAALLPVRSGRAFR